MRVSEDLAEGTVFVPFNQPGLPANELLSGSWPYDTQTVSMVQALRNIAEAMPRPLRTAEGGEALDADLQTIVAKALEKEGYDRGGAVLGIRVMDLDEMGELVVRNGAKALSYTHEIPGGRARDFQDPDGYVFELVQLERSA